MESLWISLKTFLDTALIPDFLAAFISKSALSVGVTDSELRLFLCLILAYPLAYIWRRLPCANTRHLYSVIVGFWLLTFVIGHQCVFNISSALVAYLMMKILGPSSAKYVATFSMCTLAAGHLYRQYTDYLGWTLDWTMQQMIITQKLHALAYNHKDGNDPNATEEQKQRSVKDIPSLLEFFSFLLFPANVVIGPTFEYKDYVDFAQGVLKSPPPFRPAFSRFAQGILYFGLHQAINTVYPCATLLQDKVFLNGNPFWKKCAIVWIALLGVRFKYYFGWKIAEGACCMSGLGYNGIEKGTDRALWNRVENIDVIAYEFSESLRMSSSSWNKTTNLWLRRYVYDRVAPKFRLYFTYLISAFWHGFYPGYYMFFLSVAVASSVHRNIRRTLRPRFMNGDGVTPGPYKRVYDAASMIATSMTTNYFIMSFVTLALNLSLRAFDGFRFAGHYALLAAVLIFNTGVVPKPKKTVHAKTS